MLAHPTLDQLHALGLAGMAKAFGDLAADPEAGALGHADWLALLLDREAAHRQDRRFTARLRHARLRQQAAPEDIDYRASRGLDRALMKGLLQGDWIDAGDSLVITGPPDSASCCPPRYHAKKSGHSAARHRTAAAAGAAHRLRAARRRAEDPR
jgi:DNA replication protein DnaC